MIRDLAALAVLVLALAAILILCAGCAAAPTQSVPVTPTATAAPSLSAGDGAKIMQKLDQLQITMTKVTTSYALDAERAKLQAQKQRDARLADAADKAMWLGFVLLALALPAPFGEKMKALLVILAVSLLAGSQAVPMFWPF